MTLPYHQNTATLDVGKKYLDNTIGKSYHAQQHKKLSDIGHTYAET